MSRECLTCGKISEDKKLFYELSGRIGPRHICKDCALEVGIKNFMSAGFNSNTGVLKKYAALHPEAQERLNKQLEAVGELNAQIKSDINGAAQSIKKAYEDKQKYAKLKKKSEIKCTCQSCNNVFSYGSEEVVKNLVNILHWNVYTMNQVKDVEQCPQCGSRAIKKEEVYFWVDKDNNFVEFAEK